MRGYQISEEQFKKLQEPSRLGRFIDWTAELEAAVKLKRGPSGQFCGVPADVAAYEAAFELSSEEPKYEGAWAYYFVTSA